jgi:hypothetical protein
MARFVLRYSGSAPPEEHAGIVDAASNVKVLDRSGNMMLLEGNEEDARQLADQLPGWTLNPEVRYGIPDARKRIGSDSG